MAVTGTAAVTAIGRARPDEGRNEEAAVYASKLHYLQALNLALRDEMARDSAVFLMGADIPPGVNLMVNGGQGRPAG